MAYRRLQALQKLQPWPQVSLSTSSSQNSLAKPEKAPESNYSDLDCKILQLCGEDGSGGTRGRGDTQGGEGVRKLSEVALAHLLLLVQGSCTTWTPLRSSSRSSTT